MTSVVFYPLRSHRYMLIFGGDWGSPHPSIVFLVERNLSRNRFVPSRRAYRMAMATGIVTIV